MVFKVNQWAVKKNPPKRVLLFSVTRYNYPIAVIKLRKIRLSLCEQRTWRSCQKQLLRLYLLLHLRVLLDLQSSPTVLPLSLSHHVDPNSSPSKVILPHFFYFWICWFLSGQQGPGVDRRNQNTKYVEPMPFHKIPFGGDVESCTRVHNAFATKELQQYRYYTTNLFIGQPNKVTRRSSTKLLN